MIDGFCYAHFGIAVSQLGGYLLALNDFLKAPNTASISSANNKQKN